jgi:hypothetical protein
MDAEQGRRISRLIREGIDWDCLLRTALWHGVMPLLHRHLNATCPEALPATFRNALEDHFVRNAKRNLLLTGELLKLLGLLEAHGIPAVPFKGPVLAASVYGSLALRQFGDLDILVRKADVLKVKDLLISLDCLPKLRLTRAQEAAYLHSQCELNFQRAADQVHLEIHWEFFPRSYSIELDPADLWGHLDPVSLAGRKVMAFSPEDLVLILSIHGAKHLWGWLEWICDIAELIRAHPKMNWDRVMSQAGSLGSARLVSLGLLLAADLLDAALPERVLQWVRADHEADALARQVGERLFREDDRRHSHVDGHLFFLRGRERWRHRVQYCVRFALTPTVDDWSSLRLPDALFFLYTLFRPLRLAGKYGLRAVRHVYDVSLAPCRS